MGANKDEAQAWMGDVALGKCGNTTRGDLSAWAGAFFGKAVSERLLPLYSEIDWPLPVCFGKDAHVDPLYVDSNFLPSRLGHASFVFLLKIISSMSLSPCIYRNTTKSYLLYDYFHGLS